MNLPISRRSLWLILALAAALSVALWPVQTRSGVDYVWTSSRITLFEKGLHFLSRDLQTRRLAQAVARGASSDQERLLKLFTWTTQNIRPVPKGFPTVDDHIWNVFVRGYGAPDQRTEAFALLASYCGFPAGSTILKTEGLSHQIILAVVQVGEEKVIPFDVANGLFFTNERGQLAHWKELQRDPQLIRAAAKGLQINGIAYERYFETVSELSVNPSRIQRQKPWPRLKMETLRLFRLPS